MADELRVALEIGPRGKQVVAVAPDWPGLERGAKSEEAAIGRLRAYLPRYAPAARLAGMEAEYAAIASPNARVTVVERYPGTGSTDFWGISFAFSDFDNQPMSSAALEHEMTLLQACWTLFDSVRSHVSAEMRKGPRGGGRDRDRIIQHTLAAELDMSAKVGVRTPLDALLTGVGLSAYRATYCDAIQAFHAQGKLARTWPLRYLIRHTAFHSLDHSWEMEDKDLTAEQAGDAG